MQLESSPDAPAPISADFPSRIATLSKMLEDFELALGDAVSEGRDSDVVRIEGRIAKAEAERHRLELGQQASLRIAIERETQMKAEERQAAIERARADWLVGDRLAGDVDVALDRLTEALDRMSDHTDLMLQHENVIDAAYWRHVVWVYETREQLLQRNRTLRFMFANSPDNSCSHNWRPVASVYPVFANVVPKS